MSLSISGIVLAQAPDAPTPVPAASRLVPQASPSEDTVALSQSALVDQLNLLGQSPLQIAESLGVPVATVNAYLDIPTTTTPTPAVAPTATLVKTASAA
jgi:hypothetical protein